MQEPEILRITKGKRWNGKIYGSAIARCYRALPHIYLDNERHSISISEYNEYMEYLEERGARKTGRKKLAPEEI